MTVSELLGKLLAPDSPWLLALAVLVLVAAAGIGRRLFASQRAQGARIGALERRADSERTRRRQVEAELVELGIPLPYWPDDPADPRELAVLRRRLRELDVPPPADDEDLEDEYYSAGRHGPTPTRAELATPPVPTPTPTRR